MLHPQREHLSLRRRKRVKRLPYPLLRFLRDQPIEGAIFTHVIRFFHGHCFPAPSFCPSSIRHQPALDREKPCPQRACSSKRIERCERPNERVLHQLFYSLPLPGTRGETRQRLRVTTHQLRRGPAVSGFPAVD